MFLACNLIARTDWKMLQSPSEFGDTKAARKSAPNWPHSIDVKRVETNYPNLKARQLDMLLYAPVHIAFCLVSVTSSIHLFARHDTSSHYLFV